MTEAEARQLGEAIRAGIEQHKSHRACLYRGTDGIWRCPECEPPRLREWLAGLVSRQRNRVKRRRR